MPAAPAHVVDEATNPLLLRRVVGLLRLFVNKHERVYLKTAYELDYHNS